MASTNDITGDQIQSKVFSAQGRENYDFIFRKKNMKPTLKLASATWCGPCQALKAQIVKEGLSVEIIDMDTNQMFFKDHGIKSVPTLVVFGNDGHELITGSDKIFQKIKETSEL